MQESKTWLVRRSQPSLEKGKKDVHATGAHISIIPQQGVIACY
jgi:hypothetical protein